MTSIYLPNSTSAREIADN